MGDEHDSWIEGLGVKIDPPDPGEFISNVAQGVNSAVRAGFDLDHGARDMVNAANSEYTAERQYLGAEFRDGVGDHEGAEKLRDSADAYDADANAYYSDGKTRLTKAQDFVTGDDDGAPRVAAYKDEDSRKATQSRRDRKIPMGVYPMQPDCKIVRGRVPGPVNHVLCGTHNHVIDLGNKTIIALSLEDYQKRYGTGR